MYDMENLLYESLVVQKTLGIVHSKVQIFINKIHILVFPSCFVTLVLHPTFTWRIVSGLRVKDLSLTYYITYLGIEKGKKKRGCSRKKKREKRRKRKMRYGF
jgi:uncharacterized transporter YbjL